MQPLDTVNAMIAAIEAHDLDGALAHMAPDCEYDNVPMAKVVGHEAIAAVLGPFIGGCSDIEWIVHRTAATGSTVMNERTDRFKMGERWLEIAVAGVFEVHDGKITLWRDYFDEAQFRAQLGG